MANQSRGNTKITLDGHVIEVVDFKQLGSMMLSTESGFKTRRGQAWNAFNKMQSIWRSIVVPIKIKAKIFGASCLSILIYGCESWIITQQLGQQINSFAITAYRLMTRNTTYRQSLERSHLRNNRPSFTRPDDKATTTAFHRSYPKKTPMRTTQ